MNSLLNQLNTLREKKLVKMSRHPSLPLMIWNYSAAAQYQDAFKEYPLLSHLRGLVTDGNGHVVARPFKKFWNYEQYDLSEIPLIGEWMISNKMDGSLIIVFKYNDQPVFASRGSFKSSQAIDAHRIFSAKYDENLINPNYTYLFEFISPENRIVVAYDQEELILLGVIDTASGNDVSIKNIDNFPKADVVHVGSEVNTELFDALKSMNKANEEGVVAHHIPSGFRMKIKYDDYIDLHKRITGVSTKTIWEYLSQNKDIEALVENVPDEFYQFVKTTVNDLRHQYSIIEKEAELVYHKVKHLDSKKDMAQILLSQYKSMAHIVFKMIDGKDYSDIIWKLIEPEYYQPFSGDL